MLSPEEIKRYDRQIRIRGFGEEGQRRLGGAKVAVVGLGGLGCPVSLYLTAAGVGYLRLIDKDRVGLQDLNRQILYRQEDVGEQKAELAARRLRELNPHVEVEPVATELNERNAVSLLGDVDLVVDCLDNWTTRFVVNDACVSMGKPFIHAGIRGFYGQVTTVMPGEGPCLRCIIKTTPPEEGIIPVLGATAAAIASLEAMEAIKLITGLGEPLVGRLLLFNGLEMRFEEVIIKRDSKCPVCGRLR